MKRWLTFHAIALEIRQQHPGISKDAFAELLAVRFDLKRIGTASVYYADDFAVCFCESKKYGFAGTATSLKNIKAFDDRPFLVNLLKPETVETFLANSSFIEKLSHTSQRLSLDRVRGSFNGSNILRVLNSITNMPENFERLHEFHRAVTWEKNFERIVAATEAIVGKGKRFEPTEAETSAILATAERSHSAEASGRVAAVESALQKLLKERSSEVLVAAQIRSGKSRGDAIESAITGAANFHRLEDTVYESEGEIRILVDLKTKLSGKASAPKLYNTEKTVRRLVEPTTIFCMFFIGVDTTAGTVAGRLLDILDASLIDKIAIQPHWSGRNARPSTQLCGSAADFLQPGFKRRIDVPKAKEFLRKLIAC